MTSLRLTTESPLGRTLAWLAAAWLFVVVTEVDRFHNHSDLEQLCPHDGHCHVESAEPAGHDLDGRLSGSSDLCEQSGECLACLLWSVLSSSDFAAPPCESGDGVVGILFDGSSIGGPVTSLLVCFGRSPPVLR